MTRWTVAIGNYPHTAALKSGAVHADGLTLEFPEIKPVNRAFAPMARELKFDVSEMAVATFLQAKAYGKPLTLLPLVMAARFQEAALFRLKSSAIRSPADLKGKRVGVRAYSQTTGLWVRGVISDSFGVAPNDIAWTTFEGAHVLEYPDPPFVRRAEPGKELVKMRHDGELDAIIVGNDVPDDPELTSVFPDPKAAADAFWNKHHFVPDQSRRRDPHRTRDQRAGRGARTRRTVRGLQGRERKTEAGARQLPARPRQPSSPRLQMAMRLALEQGLLPHPLNLQDLWLHSPEIASLS